MAKPVGGLTVFENNTTNSLVNLDANFTAIANAINDPGSYTNYGIDSGAVNALVLTLTGYSLAAYADGQIYTVKVAVTNTGSATLNVNTLGTKTILRKDGTALQAGDMVAGNSYQFIYNSSLSGGVGGFNLVDSLPAGLIPNTSGNITVTGTLIFSAAGTAIQLTSATGAIDWTPGPATFTLGGTSWMSVATTRAVTINAPSSGTTITLASVAAGNSLVANQSGGGAALTVAAAGNVTINTPSSGTALSVNGVASGIAASFTDNTNYTFQFTKTASAGGALNINTNAVLVLAIGGTECLTIGGTSHATTLNTPASGNHQFNGLTQYSDGTTNAEVGWRGLPLNVQTANYTFVLADRARMVSTNNSGITYTYPPNVFQQTANLQDILVVTNSSAGSITIAQGAGVTLRLAGTATTGNRTIASKGIATITGISGTEAWVSGPGVS